MRKRIKHPKCEPRVTSIDPDNVIRDLRDEKPIMETEKKKELTFTFTKDFELVPLPDEKIVKKLTERV